MTKTYSVVNASFTIAAVKPETFEVQDKSGWDVAPKFLRLTQGEVFRTSGVESIKLFDHYVRIGYLKLVSEVDDPPAAPVTAASPEPAAPTSASSTEPAEASVKK